MENRASLLRRYTVLLVKLSSPGEHPSNHFLITQRYLFEQEVKSMTVFSLKHYMAPHPISFPVTL